MRLRRNTPKARVEMLPLMDVVFLLLVFFIFAMMTMSVHRGMGLNLPSSGSAELEKKTHLALTAMADGTVYLDKQAVDPETLTALLAARNEQAKEPDGITIQVFAEDTLSYQGLYRVLDRIKAAGIKKISLQARKDGTP